MPEGGPIRAVCVAGARPNFMKIAPLVRALQERGGFETFLVHTGQHYDERLSRLFFEQLKIPQPDVNLGVGSASHAVQTAEVMKRLEPLLAEQAPHVVIVVGDVNSTLAAALVAVKLGVPVAHVEAGLRSFDRRMPEEINRLLTDAVSDFLFVTEASGLRNLAREGADPEKVHFVGNVMIDTLLANLERARRTRILEDLGLQPRRYAAMTLHRPGNVDDPDVLARLLEVVGRIAQRLPVVFPVHPRTRRNLERWGLRPAGPGDLRLIEPLGYLEFLRLMAEARVVLTDSGGVQEETTILKVPCLTLRENTERPVTVEVGCNRVVGTDPARILAAFEEVMARPDFTCATPEKWDGRAAERIAQVLAERLG